MIHHPFSNCWWRLLTASCLLTSLTVGISASAQLPPMEALEKLVVAEDMEVTLFASEPMIRNPTSIDVDEKGRVWVLEGANYRLFNQAIADEKGDRIRVLEDTDGDGRADSFTTFYQDPSLQAPIGIAVLGDRVYVCQAPDLFYLQDTDGDGMADKKTVILTGFKGVDHDHAIHGIQFGPDGYLYMSVGDQGMEVTDGSGRTVHTGPQSPEYIAATVLRTDMEGKHLEVLASNMRNPYEPTVDAYGNVYISDNDDDGNEQTRIDYVFEGGTYGYRMPDTVSRRKGNRRLDAVHWNEDQPGVVPKMIKTGFGSPTGLMMYEGVGLPQRLLGQLIHCDAGPREVRAFNPMPDGAGKSAEKEILLSSPEDSWFRPIDVCAAPDGSLLVADWYDAGVGGHRMVDAQQGRIYRLTKKGYASKYTMPVYNLKTAQGITNALASPNQAYRFLAHRAWHQLINDENVDEIILSMPNVPGSLTLTRPVLSPRITWLLAQHSGIAKKVVSSMLQVGGESDSSVADRILAVRLMSRFIEGSDEMVEQVINDPNPGVRRQLLLEMGFPYPGDQGKLSSRTDGKLYAKWFKALQAQYDGQDRFYREALGIAARRYPSQAYAAALNQFGQHGWNAQIGGLAFQYHPAEAFDFARSAAENTELEFELRELALRTIAAIGNDTAGEFLVNTALKSTDAELQVLAFHLLKRHGGDVWREAMDTHGFDTAIGEVLTSGTNVDGILAFIREANRTGAIDSVLNAVTTPELAPTVQVKYLNTLESIISNGKFDQFAQWVKKLSPLLESPDVAVQTATVATLANLRGDAVGEALIPFLQDTAKDRAPRVQAVRALARDKRSTQTLLEWAQAGDVPEDLKFSVGEALRNSSDAEVKAQALQLFPPENTVDGKPLPPMDQLVRMNGDIEKGRAVFFDENKSTCSRCHDVATSGKEIGPHLGKIGEKLAKQSLIESILDPNAAISHEYQAWFIDTKDEEGLTGYIRSEDAKNVELMDSAGVVKRLPVESITSREASPVSIMPSGLTAGMMVQELVDLVAYLETLK